MLTVTNELKQGSVREKISFGVVLFLVFLLSLVFIFPFYWMLKGAFQPSSMAMEVPPHFFPVKLTLDNFVKLFTKTQAMRWFLNTFIVAGSACVLTILIGSMGGYAFAKKKFPGREPIFWVLLTAMMLPKQVMLIPLYIMMNKYGLYDTYPGMFLPMVAWPLGLFLFRQFMQGIPDALLDAARIDGAGEFATFRHVILPMCTSALATVGILYFVNTWNDYMWQLIITKSTNMATLSVGISKVTRTESAVDYGLLMAGATFGSFFIGAAFLFFQKYFVRGITMGAVKG